MKAPRLAMDCVRTSACLGLLGIDPKCADACLRTCVPLLRVRSAIVVALMLREPLLLPHCHCEFQEHASSMAARRLLHLSICLAANPKADMPSVVCHVAWVHGASGDSSGLLLTSCRGHGWSNEARFSLTGTKRAQKRGLCGACALLHMGLCQTVGAYVF